MTNQFKAIIGKTDVPNENGRTYPTETWLKTIDDFNKRLTPLYGGIGSNVEDQFHPQEVTHQITSIKVAKNGDVVATVKVSGNETTRKILENHLSDDYGFRPVGYGMVNEDGVVTDYEIVSISLVKDPA